MYAEFVRYAQPSLGHSLEGRKFISLEGNGSGDDATLYPQPCVLLLQTIFCKTFTILRSYGHTHLQAFLPENTFTWNFKDMYILIQVVCKIICSYVHVVNIKLM